MMHYHLKVFFSRPRFSCAQAFICSLLAFVATTDVTAAPETHGLLEITGTKTPYLVQFLVPGSDYLSIHGLTFDSHDQLYVGSVMGQAIYTVDLASGNSSEFIGPPHGMSDDLEFGPDGTLVWTSILTGQVHARRPDGRIVVLAENLPGVNAIAFRGDGRLFVTQVLWSDALWELDINGVNPPRKVLADIGHLNGFDFDRDGYLYGPLMYKGVVVRIDVDSGEMETLASGFGVPVAVNLDSKDNLYVADSKLGRIIRVDIESGEKTLVATVETGIDNLAFNSKDELFITNLVDNAILQINTRTGAARTIVRSELCVPGGIDVVSENGTDQIYLGDLFSFSRIDGNSGKVSEIKRGVRDHVELPMAVGVQSDRVITSSWFADAIEVFDRSSGESLASYHNLDDPVDAVILPDGSILAAEQGKGRLVLISQKDDGERRIVAVGIEGIAAMRPHTADEVYLTDIARGELLRVNITSGEKTVVVGGLHQPEGFDVAPDGTIVLAEVGKKRVIRIDPVSGAISEIARNLAIGYPAAEGTPSVYITTGVGVSPSGAIYVSSDVNTALYKITAQ
jgi:sugar lactone lactonase YvrE